MNAAGFCRPKSRTASSISPGLLSAKVLKPPQAAGGLLHHPSGHLWSAWANSSPARRMAVAKSDRDWDAADLALIDLGGGLFLRLLGEVGRFLRAHGVGAGGRAVFSDAVPCVVCPWVSAGGVGSLDGG